MYRSSLFRQILYRSLGGAGALPPASVYLLALNAADQWEIVAGPLPVINLKVTRLADQASSASFDLLGFDVPISLENRIFISSPYFSFGGVVYGLTKTKSGYHVEVLDFIEALDGNIIYDTVYQGKTDLEIISDLLANNLYVPLSLSLLEEGEAVPIRQVTFNEISLLEAIRTIAKLTGKFFYCSQSSFSSAPNLRYLAPPGAPSGFNIPESHILSNYSSSQARDTIYTKIKIRAVIDDVPMDNAWIANETHAQSWGILISNYSQSTPPPSSWGEPVGKTSDYRRGYKIFVPIDRNIATVKIMAAKAGTPSDLKIKRMLPNGTIDSYTLLTASEASTSTALYTKTISISLSYGVNYIELYTETLSDSDYWVIASFDTGVLIEGLDIYRGAKLGGCESVLEGTGADIWATTAAEKTEGIALMLQTTGYDTGWTVTNGAIGNEPHNGCLILTKTEADPYSEASPWFAPQMGNYPVSIQRAIFPSVSYMDSSKLSIKAYYTYADRPTDIKITLFSNSASAYKQFSLASQQTISLDIGPSTGWTESGTMDWANITAIKIETGAMIIEALRFEGSEEMQTALSTQYRRLYDQKVYSESVTFQRKSDMAGYASNLLEIYKKPQEAVTVTVKGIVSPQLYSLIDVGPWENMLVRGIEWDLRRKTTTLTLGHFPTRKLSFIISQLLKGGKL